MALAVKEAQRFVGATAPNPPVGACVVLDNRVIAVAAHERAGTAHAEASAIELAAAKHNLAGATLYVTLEPCNHVGRMPACTEKILSYGIQTIIYGVADPNPNVKGGGADYLRSRGLSVTCYQDLENNSADLSQKLQALIAPFTKYITQGRPFILHKLAYRRDNAGLLTLLPEPGAKTFTREESLKLAHLARKQSDAIITGLGTVLADKPLFSVRHPQDHTGKTRILAVLSQSGRKPPSDWVARQEGLGFRVHTFSSMPECLEFLGKNGVLQALVEAGPTLSQHIEETGGWDERLIFLHDSDADFCYTERTCSPALSKT